MVRAALFDVDGTLVDSNFLHVHAWSVAFAEAGTPVTAVEILRRIGMSGEQLVDELAGEGRDDINDGWRRAFDQLKPRLRAFDGAAELLRELHDRGVRVVLATSSPEEDVEALRAAIGADDAIDAVTSAGDVKEAKPAPDIFSTALERAGVDAADAVVIGDTVWDVEAARRSGLECIGVLTGGICRGDLEQAGALAVYDSVAHLLDELDSSPLVWSDAG
jgi:HAD superfamily hydrolase (TIGR01509 family)